MTESRNQSIFCSSERVERVVVGDLSDQFFEEIDMGCDVGPMHVPDVFNCCFECFTTLLGEAVIA